jgi:hypothetical protein
MIQLHTRTGLLKRTSIALFLVIATVLSTKAQLKIGDQATTINKSAILELQSTKQGFLLPRLTDTAAINGLTPPDGMIIYLQTTTGADRGLYIRKSGIWQRITTDSTSNRAWTLNGNNISATDRFGSLNGTDVIMIAGGAERMRLKVGGAVSFLDSVYIGNRLQVKDSISTSIIRALDTVIARNAKINDSLYLNPALIQSAFNDILVINPTTGAVSKRTLDPAAFKGLTIGNFSETGTAQGLERKAGGTNAPDTLILHAATFTTAGGVSTLAQNIAGNKTFRDSVLVGSGSGGGVPNSTLQVKGSVSYSIKTYSTAGTYTLTENDYTLLVDPTAGNITVTLPTPSAGITGRVYVIKKIGASDIDREVIVSGNLEGGTGTEYKISNTGTFIKVQTDGTSWYIIDK